MLAVLVDYLNRVFGWEDPEDQPEFNGLGTKEAQENPPGILKTSDDYQKPPTSANRLIFHSDVIQAGKTRNYAATNQNGFENTSTFERRQMFKRGRNHPASMSVATASTHLRSAASTSNIVTSRNAATRGRNKFLRNRAETVEGAMTLNSRQARSPGQQTRGGDQQQPLKLSFDFWFDQNQTQQKTKEKPRFGNIEFSTYYDSSDSSLAIRIIKATNLPVMDLFGLTDPFVKCCLLPDRKRKLETKVKRKTLNPHWNERFMFQGLSIDKIKHRVLSLQVYDYDRFSRNDPIGDVFLPLKDLQLNQEDYHSIDLTESQGSNKRGELQLSLCYQPLEGILDVAVVKAKNLKPMDINGMSDPYVKIWLIYKGKKVEKKKTYIIKRTLNPIFEEEFTFYTPMNRMRETQLEITVMDYDKIGRNDTIGKVYLGHKSSGLEKQHWKDMLNSTRKPVSQWHVLKV